MSKTLASTDAINIGMHCPVPFTKMHGLGNDFVFLHESDLATSKAGTDVLEQPKAAAALAKRVCDRHYGIGADGLIIVRESEHPDCQIGWSYYNSDGSTSAMCGNGLRCTGLYAVYYGLVTSREFSVETEVGAVPVQVVDENTIRTSLGQPVLCSQDIPVGGLRRDRVVREVLKVGTDTFEATCLSMGNPHCVVFDSGWSDEKQRRLAPQIQALPFFPSGVNVEFATLSSRDAARVFVWERGCGPTLACASGAAAVLVAGVLEGRLEPSATIELPGGSLGVEWDSAKGVSIAGPARVSYKGIFDLGKYVTAGSQP